MRENTIVLKTSSLWQEVWLLEGLIVLPQNDSTGYEGRVSSQLLTEFSFALQKPHRSSRLQLAWLIIGEYLRKISECKPGWNLFNKSLLKTIYLPKVSTWACLNVFHEGFVLPTPLGFSFQSFVANASTPLTIVQILPPIILLFGFVQSLSIWILLKFFC